MRLIVDAHSSGEGRHREVAWYRIEDASKSMGVMPEVSTMGHFAFLLKDANATQKPESPSFSKMLSTVQARKEWRREVKVKKEIRNRTQIIYTLFFFF